MRGPTRDGLLAEIDRIRKVIATADSNIAFHEAKAREFSLGGKEGAAAAARSFIADAKRTKDYAQHSLRDLVQHFEAKFGRLVENA